MRPFDPVTFHEAAHILGVARSTVQQWIHAGRLTQHGGRRAQRTLSRAEVERLAVEVYRWRGRDDDSSYWVTGDDAAAVLGVSGARLRVLAGKGAVPFVWHSEGIRMYRREELITIAKARNARWH